MECHIRKWAKKIDRLVWGMQTSRAQYQRWLSTRFLQGWNPGRDVTTFGVQHNLEREKSGARLKKGDVSNEKEEKQLPAWNDFPRCTILPGLQFLLAGIIGKPETFYEVPAILFTFELFSYL